MTQDPLIQHQSIAILLWAAPGALPVAWVSSGPQVKAGLPGVFVDTQLCHGVSRVENIPWSRAGQPGAPPQTGQL